MPQTENAQARELEIARGYEVGLQQMIESAYLLEDKSLLEISHEGWKVAALMIDPERIHRSEDDVNKTFDEISEKNKGNNFGNLLVTSEYFVAEMFGHSKTRGAMLRQIEEWQKDNRSIGEKLDSNDYLVLERVINKAARFVHMGYTVATAKPGEYLNEDWDKTIPENRKKSFVTAALLVDGIIGRLGKNQRDLNLKSEVESIFQANLVVSPEQTESHKLWVKMLDVKFEYNPSQSEIGRNLIAAREFCLRSKDPLINGGKTFDDVQIEAELSNLTMPVVYDVTEMAGVVVQENWADSQVNHKFRLPRLYRDDEIVGSRTRVKTGQLSDETFEYLMLKWEPSDVVDQLMKQFGEKFYEVLRGEYQGQLDVMARQEVEIDLDPRISLYQPLENLDKGNNVVATAITHAAMAIDLLGKSKKIGLVAAEIAEMITEANADLWSDANGLMETMAANMHAIWAARAFQRDGIKDVSRLKQARLYRQLPSINNLSSDKDGDEKRYDRIAVVNSGLYLLAALNRVCVQSRPSIDLGEQVKTLVAQIRIID